MRSFCWILPLLCFVFAHKTQAKAMPSAAAGKTNSNQTRMIEFQMNYIN